MPLQTSGPISLFDVQSEFGGSNPIEINEYRRGLAYVNSNTAAGTGSFTSAPLPATSPVQIAANDGSAMQLSMFYGTRKLIVGNTGIITAPADSPSISDFRDFTLPAGVDLIRFFLVGGGGGGGGSDALPGGDGGGGSFIMGTINTSWAGPTNVPRTLRVFVGRGGKRGTTSAGGNSSRGFPKGGHGYPLHAFSGWTGSFINTYGVTWIQNSAEFVTPGAGADSPVMVYFPTTGNYTFHFAADNRLVILIDGNIVANTSGLNTQGATTDHSYQLNTGSELTQTVSVTAGFHKVIFRNINGEGVGGFGCYIADASNNTIYQTRASYSTSAAVPIGGTGGLSGTYEGVSGEGGGGGSGTRLSIINGDGTEFFVALAGGGGGGGGGGLDAPAYNSSNGNFRTQGYIISSSPSITAGGDGETPNAANNGVMDLGGDSAGGGGGGGGVRNPRMYFVDPARSWFYSGFGGRTWRGYYYASNDISAEGGESGLSAITSFATLNSDFAHVPTTGRTPNLAASMPVSFSGYGVGGNKSPVSGVATDGANGVAYVDWGVSDGSITPPAITPNGIIASILPFGFSNYVSTTQYQYSYLEQTAPVELFDAFGGGGKPENYTYAWSNVSGPAVSFSAPTAYRTNVTFPAEPGGSTGTFRCTVSDGIRTGTKDFSWYTFTTPPPPPIEGGA